MKRAILWGAVAAIVLVVTASLVVYVVNNAPSLDDGLERMLVIATTPGPDSAIRAPIAFTIDSKGEIVVLDTLSQVAVAGSSAQTSMDAYPFGGGDLVAASLKDQTGGDALEWIALPPEAWKSVIDSAGGVRTDVPTSMSVYTEGRLTLLTQGTVRLTGEEAIALASAIDYIETSVEQKAVLHDLTAGLAKAVKTDKHLLKDLIIKDRAVSSVEPNRFPSWKTATED